MGAPPSLNLIYGRCGVESRHAKQRLPEIPSTSSGTVGRDRSVASCGADVAEGGGTQRPMPRHGPNESGVAGLAPGHRPLFMPLRQGNAPWLTGMLGGAPGDREESLDTAGTQSRQRHPFCFAAQNGDSDQERRLVISILRGRSAWWPIQIVGWASGGTRIYYGIRGAGVANSFEGE